MRVLWVGLLVAVFSCGESSPSTSENACIPGDAKECPCVGGEQGVQECKADGSGYTKCDCGATDVTNAPDVTDAADGATADDITETKDVVQDTAAPAGTDWHVSVDGTDSDTCGDPDTPCKTLAKGLALAQPNDRVMAHAGLYEEQKLVIPDGVWLVSADGPLKARIYSGTKRAIYFHQVKGAGIDGFELYGDWNEGSAGDGLVRILDAEDIVVRNCMVHDAPHDQDCIKVSGVVRNLLIENVIAWNPGKRPGDNYQEVLDIFGSSPAVNGEPPVQDVVVRGCWFFHTPERGGDYLTYAKVDVRHILYENNIFGPSMNGGDGNANVCVGTSSANPDPQKHVNVRTVVRNNVFVGLKGDAPLGIRNASEAWVYNNVFYNNSGPDARAVIELRGNAIPLGPVYIFNNLFVGNQPEIKGGTFFWVRDELPSVFQHDYNLYHDNVADSEAPYTGEANGIYGLAPGLVDPGIPAIAPLPTSLDILSTLRDRFGISEGSPAINHGLDIVSMDGHPDWSEAATTRWDIQGHTRPTADSWDLGAHEKQP